MAAVFFAISETALNFACHVAKKGDDSKRGLVLDIALAQNAAYFQMQRKKNRNINHNHQPYNGLV